MLEIVATQPYTHQNERWTYGVWYCGTSWTKVRLHGQYPPTFLRRALALFPAAHDVLHCPSGTLTSHLTVDRIYDGIRVPNIVADAGALPLRSESLDLVLSDPPYTRQDSLKYGCSPFPMRHFLEESHRVLRVGGCLGMLHTSYPSYARKHWKLCGLIAVVTGFARATRMFSILRKQL